ncbi:MAG: FAD-dependent oxidoreductase [Treponema sp.]|jgi:succinate dehydrogenase/fumarate reductase flavoprotein subunit|nr:FAD-dependent oxidoreductase [Treponema sp.]
MGKGETKKSGGEQTTGLSRRDFLKGAAAGAAGVAVVGALSACENPTSTEYIYKDLDAEGSQKEWAFEKAPTPITSIEGEEAFDIVVVGSGMAGLTTALAAKQENSDLKILLITGAAPGSDGTNPHGAISRGGSNSSTWSTVMEAKKDSLGYSQDAWISYLNREKLAASYRVDQRKWSKFYNESEEAMDWLINMVSNSPYNVITTLEVDNYDPILQSQTVAHAFMDPGTDPTTAFMVSTGQQNTVEALAKELVDVHKVPIKTLTAARRLVRGGTESGKMGKVEAVIAEDLKTGKFYKYKASKGVVLATGDFSADLDMMAKYCPWVLDIIDFSKHPSLPENGGDGNIYNTAFSTGSGLYKGDGHKMGLWVGAAWQNAYPAAPMIQGSIGFFGSNGGYQPLGFHQGLVVNKNGERFYNEDISLPYAATLLLSQPGKIAYGIWNEDWYDTVIAAGRNFYSFGSSFFNPPPAKEMILGGWNADTSIKADNLQALCADSRIGLSYSKVLETVNQYNKMVTVKKDTDFGKDSTLLCRVDPNKKVFAATNQPLFMTVMGGLRTDDHMRVCDASDQPIPGLFNVGQMVGDVYANTYNFAIPGHCYGGNCLTFGRRLGIELAKNIV